MRARYVRERPWVRVRTRESLEGEAEARARRRRVLIGRCGCGRCGRMGSGCCLEWWEAERGRAERGVLDRRRGLGMGMGVGCWSALSVAMCAAIRASVTGGLARLEVLVLVAAIELRLRLHVGGRWIWP